MFFLQWCKRYYDLNHQQGDECSFPFSFFFWTWHPRNVFCFSGVKGTTTSITSRATKATRHNVSTRRPGRAALPLPPLPHPHTLPPPPPPQAHSHQARHPLSEYTPLPLLYRLVFFNFFYCSHSCLTVSSQYTPLILLRRKFLFLFFNLIFIISVWLS